MCHDHRLDLVVLNSDMPKKILKPLRSSKIFLKKFQIRAGYCKEVRVLCVAEKEATHMNDYMRALHQRFFREPDVSELEEDIENTRQEVRDCLDKMQRRRLMHLVDTQNLLKEEISLASFTAGFKLAWGLSKELEVDGLYSFDEEETERVCRRMEQEE